MPTVMPSPALPLKGSGEGVAHGEVEGELNIGPGRQSCPYRSLPQSGWAGASETGAPVHIPNTTGGKLSRLNTTNRTLRVSSRAPPSAPRPKGTPPWPQSVCDGQAHGKPSPAGLGRPFPGTSFLPSSPHRPIRGQGLQAETRRKPWHLRPVGA